MAQICSIIEKQALKVQYMILHGTKKSVENKEDLEEIIEDESDYIFQHSKNRPKKQLNPSTWTVATWKV